MDPVTILKTFMEGVVDAVRMTYDQETAAATTMLKTYTEFQETTLTPGQMNAWLIRNGRRIMAQAKAIISEMDALEAYNNQQDEIEEGLRL